MHQGASTCRATRTSNIAQDDKTLRPYAGRTRPPKRRRHADPEATTLSGSCCCQVQDAGVREARHEGGRAVRSVWCVLGGGARGEVVVEVMRERADEDQFPNTSP